MNDYHNYESNSHKSKELSTPNVEKKIIKAAKGVIKKKGLVSKIMDIFVTENLDNVSDSIMHDVVIPYIKKIISESITNGIDMMLYGEDFSGKSKKTSSANSYHNYYDRKKTSVSGSVKRSMPHNYEDVIFSSRSEAEDVLHKLDDLIDIYETATVADFYELAGVSGNYTDNKYGWTDIRNANVIRTRDGGFMIKLPKALPLN